jgi:hypothetical protein
LEKLNGSSFYSFSNRPKFGGGKYFIDLKRESNQNGGKKNIYPFQRKVVRKGKIKYPPPSHV